MADLYQLPGTAPLPEVSAVPESDPLPSCDDLAEEAFNLWAVLKAAGARLRQMEDDGPIGSDEFSELSRLLRHAETRAYAIGSMAIGAEATQA